MSARRLTLVLPAIVAAAVGASACGLLDGGDGLGERRARNGAGADAGDRAGRVARVVRVVDGDTIHVQLGATRERVRYIGIDTPETTGPARARDCYGRQASDLNARLVAGEQVRLVRDVEQRDRYGRLLAYVYRARDGLFVNAELARRGYARPLPIAPDVRHAGRFAELAREARRQGRGLWSACSDRPIWANLP